MLITDNQQATTISWFTSILEGEGSFKILPSGSGEVSISNTDLDIIESCESFLRKNCIWFSRYTYRRDGRPEYIIRLQNSQTEILQYAKMLYDLISPSLECRYNEYQTILGAPTTTRGLSIDHNWLAGIFEAEGSLSLTLDYRGSAAFAITISNTNTRIIDKVMTNLKSMHCGFHIRDKIKAKDHYKDARIVAITGMLRCRTFLSTMTGLWVSTRWNKMAALLDAFIGSRLLKSRKCSYSPKELQIIQAVIDLNG